MPRRRLSRTLSAPIGLVLVDWLLEGQPRPANDSDPLRNQDVYDWCIEFDTPGPDLHAVWDQNRTWLLTEAARRCLDRPWGLRFDDGQRDEPEADRFEDERERRRQIALNLTPPGGPGLTTNGGRY
jgi:hypothetical protein